MLCVGCGSTFDVIPILEGKSISCAYCGTLLYKRENNSIIINLDKTIVEVDENKQHDGIVREKEIRYKEQVERKQKEQEFRERLEQERLVEEKIENERKQKEKEEQDRLFQLQIEDQKLGYNKLLQAELEKERVERERLEKELQELTLQHEREEKLLQEKIAAAKLEKEITERKRISLELQEKLRLEQQQLENEKLAQLELKKNSATINITAQNNPKTIEYKSTKNNNWTKFAMPLFVVCVAAILVFTLKNKMSSFAKNKITNTALASTDSNLHSTKDYSTDTILMNQLKANLIGKEILSWNTIQPNEIKNLTILSGSENKENSQYVVQLNLEDSKHTKATAELNLQFDHIKLNEIEIIKISYTNIAPVNAWFTFAPIPNCTILINTNNNPIQLKACSTCAIKKIVSNEDITLTIDNMETISIKSDNKYDAEIEFTYLPLKING